MLKGNHIHKIGWVAGIAACIVAFQNCAPQNMSFNEDGINDAQVIQIPVDVVGMCTTETLQNIYKLSVTTHEIPVTEFAANCVDSANSYSQIMATTGDQAFNNTRLKTTCAVRWCSSSNLSNLYGELLGLERGEAIGVVKSQIQQSASGLNPQQTLTVECRNNFKFVFDHADSCRKVVENKKPVEAFEHAYGFRTACGASASEASAHYVAGNAVACATEYCRGRNEGFKTGLLTEVGTGSLKIVCSRAD